MQVKIYHNRNCNFCPFGVSLKEVFSYVDLTFNEGIPVQNAISIVLENAFHMFNEGDCEIAKAYRANHLRSLSVNDVAVVGETAFQCDVAGWFKLTTDQLKEALAKERCSAFDEEQVS